MNIQLSNSALFTDMPLLGDGDGFLEEDSVQSLQISRDSDHLLKPETFLVKETKDWVCQMPNASTAHSLSLLHYSLKDWMTSLVPGQALRALHYFQSSTPGSWTHTSPHLTAQTKQGRGFCHTYQHKSTDENSCLLEPQNLWDCTIKGLFSDLFQTFLSFP